MFQGLRDLCLTVIGAFLLIVAYGHRAGWDVPRQRQKSRRRNDARVRSKNKDLAIQIERSHSPASIAKPHYSSTPLACSVAAGGRRRGRLQVLVPPGQPAFVAVADEAGARESVELAGIDDQFRWTAQRLERLIHLLAAERGTFMSDVPPMKSIGVCTRLSISRNG